MSDPLDDLISAAGWLRHSHPYTSRFVWCRDIDNLKRAFPPIPPREPNDPGPFSLETRLLGFEVFVDPTLPRNIIEIRDRDGNTLGRYSVTPLDDGQIPYIHETVSERYCEIAATRLAQGRLDFGGAA